MGAESRDAILDSLKQVLGSRTFEGSGRSRALLQFLVEETLNGRSDRLKEYTIGAEALGRGELFDPRTDPIVRAEASRLRTRIEHYYASEGQNDRIAIELPKGAYIPRFRTQEIRPGGGSSGSINQARSTTMAYAAAIVVMGVLAAALWNLLSPWCAVKASRCRGRSRQTDDASRITR
jgi:hypothetical protein